MKTYLAQRKGTHWIRLFLLKVNIIIWISENQELQRNPMKSSDPRTNSKYKSSYGCRTNSHCVKFNWTTLYNAIFSAAGKYCSIVFI